jgi:hypothetical protein
MYNINMFLSVHSIVALTSIKYIHNPLLLFIVNFILHYILDAIPHGDGNDVEGLKNNNLEMLILACVDLMFVGILSYNFYLIFNYNIYLISIALSGAILPDILWGLCNLTKFKIFKWADDINLWAHQIIKYKSKHLFEYTFQLIPIIICYFLLK